MLMDNKKSNFSISSNKNSMVEKKITGKKKRTRKILRKVKT